MTDALECGILCYLFVAFVLVIATSSWMINVTNSERWYHDISIFMHDESVVPQVLKKSWEVQPFKDMIVIGGKDACPGVSEEVAYAIFPGTRMSCDCLEREGDRDVFMDQVCQRGKNAPHNSEDCLDSGSLHPIVMNSISGFKYCGERGGSSLLEIVRPIKISESESGRQYACPESYIACNDYFFDEAEGQDFVICYPEAQSREESCPITSIAFVLDNEERLSKNYQSRFVGLSNKEASAEFRENFQADLYFSRDVMQHGIERIVISPNQPCMNTQQYSASSEEQFYFGDLRYNERTCTSQSDVYQRMTQNPLLPLNQFDFEYENYVQNKLDEKLHYTYSVWPSNEFKKDVKLDFFQKPVYNYRLECDLDENTTKDISKEKFLETYTANIFSSSWLKALDSYKQLAVAGLCVMLILPVASGRGTVILTPVAFIIVAGMFVKPMLLTFQASSELSELAGIEGSSQEQTAKFNSCLESSAQLNFGTLAASQVGLENVANRMHILATLMLIFIIQVFACLTCGSILLIANIFVSGNSFQNTAETIKGGICKSCADFFKYYTVLN